MKCKIRMSYSIELFVEGKDEEEIYDWMSEHTPEEVKKMVSNLNSEEYDDEIICNVRDDSFVDYIIE